MNKEQFRKMLGDIHAVMPSNLTGQQTVDLIAVIAVCYIKSTAEISLMMSLATDKALMVTEAKTSVDDLFKRGTKP